MLCCSASSYVISYTVLLGRRENFQVVINEDEVGILSRPHTAQKDLMALLRVTSYAWSTKNVLITLS